MPVAPSNISVKTVDGLTVYAVFRHVSDLTAWNTFTSALESFQAGHWYSAGSNNYAVAATKTVQSANVCAEYSVQIPSMAAGTYFAELYIQQGVTPAVTDGPPAWVIEDIQWIGFGLLSLTASIPSLPYGTAGGLPVLDNNLNVQAAVPANKIASPQNFNNTNVSGAGANACTMTITTNLGAPVAGARVWVSSDPAGQTIVAGTSVTSASGRVTFLLNGGSTYYLWMTAVGENSINGQSFVAVPD